MPAQFAHVTGWLAFRSWLSRTSWRWLVWCGCTIIALSLMACHSDAPASAQQNRPREEAGGAKEAPPQNRSRWCGCSTPLERTTAALGSLVAFDQATISVKVPGRLRTITVDLGSLVQRGQLIAQIEPQDYQLRVQQAEAAVAQARVRLGLPATGTNDNIDQEQTSVVRQARVLAEEARANRDRLASLLEQGITPRAQVDTAEASYKVALSRLEDAREEIHNRRAVLSSAALNSKSPASSSPTSRCMPRSMGPSRRKGPALGNISLPGHLWPPLSAWTRYACALKCLSARCPTSVWGRLSGSRPRAIRTSTPGVSRG